MQAHLAVVVSKAREAVAVFLARGWAARLVACALVSLAAVVWLGALVVLLRIVSMIALVAAVAWLAWLVGRIWRQRSSDWEAPGGSLTRLVQARARALALRGATAHGDSETVERGDGLETHAARWEAGLADVRGALTALHADLLGWHERLVDEVERCQSEITTQIDALHELVGSTSPPEQLVSPRVETPVAEMPTAARVAAAGVERDEPDLEAVLYEIEAELRLDRIEERERLVAEREERLDRRERDIAAFVTQTQARIG